MIFTVSIEVSANSKLDRIKGLMGNITLEQKIPQMLMIDFSQWRKEGEAFATYVTVLNEEVADIIDEYDFGGVILFDNNLKETEQTLKLTNDIQKAAMDNKAGNGSIPLFINIDQEAG